MQPTNPARAPRGWLLIRVTGLFLAVLLPLHLAVILLRDDIGRMTFATASDRLGARWWPGLEWVTMMLALVHGFLIIQARAQHRVQGALGDIAVVLAGVAALLLGIGVTWGMLRFS
jgi:succinate dehydrogenase hydrophobic anchor subunit